MKENTASSPVRTSHQGHKVAATQTHPPPSFTILRWTNGYKLLLASICPFLFVHLGSISLYVLAQLEFYLDY